MIFYRIKSLSTGKDNRDLNVFYRGS
jgi:hypothetical protein